MPDSAPQPKYRLDYRPPAYRVTQVELDFDLIPAATRVRSKLTLSRHPAGGGGPLVLQGEKMKLLSLALNGKALTPADYHLDEEQLTIAVVPDDVTLESEVEINPAANVELEGLYVSGGNFCTQCEPESFRRITFYPDRPDVMAPYRVRMAADKAAFPVLLCNGNLKQAGDLPGGRHFALWDDPWPKPSYLFALVAGDLEKLADSFVTRSGRKVALAIWARRADLDKLQHAMDSLKKSMRWDEEVYGREYDLDVFNIVAVSDFNMGAMENKSLNIFNTKYVLAKPETATDGDYRHVEAVIAHEYFHNWSGNRVTCRDWFQLSLKEGFTVFRDQQFSQDMGSAAVERIHQVNNLRARQLSEDAGPMAHPIRPDSYIEMNNFYTPTVYEKGAEVIRMLHRLIGPEAFRKGSDLYFARHDGTAVTCDDFVDAMQEASGEDLSQFRLWYSQAGTPELAVESHWDETAKTFTLEVAQRVPPTPGQPDKVPMLIPLSIGLLDEKGHDVAPRLVGEGLSNQGTTRTLHLRQAKERFTFTGLASRPTVSLLRGYSAPVKLTGSRSPAELMFLMAHDSDPFARWEAGQQYASQVLLALAADWRAGRPLVLEAGLVAAFAATLDDAALDGSFKALAVTLPDEDYLGEQQTPVDVEALHAARVFARQTIGQTLLARWRALVAQRDRESSYRYDNAAVARRTLANVALSYLVAAKAPEAEALLLAQLESADNMTDGLAALQELDGIGKAREAALARFAAHWRHEALVMDKWFAAQACYDLPDALARVRALLTDESFDYKNPNKVYALIATFASYNHLAFHAADGSGYDFLVEQLALIDAINSQVAARLVRPLARWRRYDARRQGQMRAALERLIALPKLSKGVFEIVSKSLE